ncbi:MAG: glycosyltransferase family 1 protein [Roseiflexaceae bacterium]|nr:glycosyltransferase family 1 protein [Roseiflexaceae bacterium]
MRILCTFAGGSGHLEPLIPIARAAEAAGHDLAFVGRPWMLPKAAALGFAAFAAGSDVGLTPLRRPLAEVDLAREIQAIGRGFGRRVAGERAADMLPLCATWQPDLLVCEEMDFGAMIAAERLALPHATVLVIAAGGFVRPDVVAAPLNAVRATHGLPPDPELAMLGRQLTLVPFPPSYRYPNLALPARTHPFRSHALDPLDAAPAWIAGLPDVPTVYFTLGTVFNVESGDLFQRVLAGLRDLPINLVVTVGRDIDPAEFGPQPTNVYIERYIPQSVLLPHCRLVVSHGGSGSVIGALAHGLPMVLIPMGADQPLNAARCEVLSIAQTLDAVAATPAMVREAVTTVLANPSYQQAAERLRDEIAALPGPEHVVRLLEQLVAKQQLRE